MPARGPAGQPSSQRPTLAAAAERLLLRHWWRPTRSALAVALQPLSALYGWLLARRQRQASAPPATPVPVVVVGNLVVGGAGKTPVVLALVQALQARGWRPGVVSRGHGRSSDAVLEVTDDSPPALVGDEPLLLRRRTGAPVWVGRQRAQAVQALCASHPQVDVVVSDDGLQHQTLARAAEWWLFDDRGIGNGLLLPAGPLRQPLPAQLPPQARVLYSGTRRSTPLPGALVPRHIAAVLPLQAWWQGDEQAAVPVQQLSGRQLLAVAGIAAPEQFFAMLRAAGLQIEPCPQPDHAAYDSLPWPAGTTEVITTEKDAVKLPPEAVGTVRVWVARLDLDLPAELLRDLAALLHAAAHP